MLDADGDAYEGDVGVNSFPKPGGVKNGKTDGGLLANPAQRGGHRP